jgi:hypothetical protein
VADYVDQTGWNQQKWSVIERELYDGSVITLRKANGVWRGIFLAVMNYFLIPMMTDI